MTHYDPNTDYNHWGPQSGLGCFAAVISSVIVACVLAGVVLALLVK